MIRAFPLSGELDHGYLGRLMRINRTNDPKIFLRKIAAWAGLTGRNFREVSRIKLLASASGLSLPQFVSRHTTLPLRRGITSYCPDELHGDETNTGVLWTSALRATRPEIYFCSDCIKEDLHFRGYSYWRREWQIPGLLWCPKHGIPLKYIGSWEVAMAPPCSVLEQGRQVENELVSRLQSNAAIKRFLDLSSGLMERNRPFNVAAIRPVLKAAAAKKGFQTWGGKASAPLISDHALDVFDEAWLQIVFPDLLGRKRRGEVMHQMDGALYMNTSASDVSAYLLVASLLFDNSDTALNEFAKASRTPQPCSVAPKVEKTLDSALRAVIQDLPDVPTQLKCRRRRYFGWSLILTAPLCLVLALVPAPFLTPVDHLVWFVCTNIFLLLGGWQVDKAAKDEERISRILRGEGDVPPPSVSCKFFLRRAK